VTTDEVFSGFPSRSEATPIPAAFFSEVLPQLDDLVEVKVFLVALRRIKRGKGTMRLVSDAELRTAPELCDQSPEAIDQAATSVAKRGLLIGVPLTGDGIKEHAAYFLNDPEGRKAAAQVRTGAVEVATGARGLPTEAGRQETPPNIFMLYEETIGPLPGAGIAEELGEADAEYPDDWIADAFKEAAAQNVRRWAYVRAILTRWREEGRKETIDGTAERRSQKGRYRTGRYGQVVRWK
jgi:DNA replication protein